MQNIKIYVKILGLVFLLVGCGDLPFQSTEDNTASVNFALHFSNDPESLGKAAFVASVELRISGPGMRARTEQLTIENVGGARVATGDFKVKRGDNRRFAITGKDAAGNQIFHGVEVEDLDEKNVSIEIDLEWDPVALFYDDANFEEYRFAREDGVSFITGFVSPISNYDLIGVRLYINGNFDFDIDVYDANFNYLDTKEVSVRTTNFGWQTYELESLGLNLSESFYLAVFVWDGPDQENSAYGPYVGVDTNNSGNSYVYIPSVGSTQSFPDGTFGIRAIVLFDGLQKEVNLSPLQPKPVLMENWTPDRPLRK